MQGKHILACDDLNWRLWRMIISPGRKFIFVHIPKTGGTSMALALEDRAHKDDILIGDTPKAQLRKPRLKKLRPSGRLWKHSTLADINGILSPQAMADLFVFTLVRNPWDRMVSYYHWLRAQSFNNPAVSVAKTNDFAGFLSDRSTQMSVSNWPYANYLIDATGTERCQLFARIEALDTDLDPLWSHLGFRLTVPHVNKSDRPSDYRFVYTEATAEVVARLCAPDISRFGYRFGA